VVKEGPCEEDSQFASVCGFMRRSGANIEHRGGGGSKKSEDEFAFLDHVWHEPILDGYWNEIEDNIRRRQLRSIAIKIQGIYIENVEIKKPSRFLTTQLSGLIYKACVI